MKYNYFIYHSKLFESYAAENEIQTIVEKARARNAAAGITGYMYVSNLDVLQYLEGEQVPLNDIRDSIFRDPRHRDVILIGEGEMPSARFAKWAMGLGSQESVAPLRFPPFGLNDQDYIVFLEVAAARTQRNAKYEGLGQPKTEG